jgi:chromosome partitioning protein
MFTNLKGGVGKSVSSVNIATMMAMHGKKTLIVDCDKQANSTNYLGVNSNKTLYNALIGECDLKDTISKTSINGLDIIPSDIKLMEFNSPKYFDIVNNDVVLNYETIQKYFLPIDFFTLEFNNIKDYDYVVFDCPPNFNSVIRSVFNLSNSYIFIPVKLDNWAITGLNYLIRHMIREVKKVNKHIYISGMFVTMDNQRTIVSRELKKFLNENLSEIYLDIAIRKNQELINSTMKSIPVVKYKPYANASIDYRELYKKIIKIIEN